MKNRVAYECEAGHSYYFDEEDHGPTCECKLIDHGNGTTESVECDAPARPAEVQPMGRRAGLPG